MKIGFKLMCLILCLANVAMYLYVDHNKGSILAGVFAGLVFLWEPKL